MNLGINTTQPQYLLDVNGTANFSSITLGAGNISLLASFNSLAIGYQVGRYGLGSNTLALGYQAGFSNQGQSGTAIGMTAGAYSQGLYGIALGNAAGFSNQGQYTTAIGYQAGFVVQSNYGVGIGYTAGYSNQGSNAIAIGNSAGYSNQGSNSIAIGWLAGQATTAIGSIILNASGAALNTTTSGLFVNPVRFVTGACNMAYYNAVTNEIAYSDTTQLSTITTVRLGAGGGTNASNALLVTGTQSNTGNLFIGGTTLLAASSNTGTLGVAGVTTLSNTSNTGTLTVTGAASVRSLTVNGTQTNTANLVANANLYAGYIPGTLPTSTSVTTFSTGFNNPHCGCIDPTGTRLYITNFNTSQIFSVVIATGVATVLSTSGTATTNPTAICIDPLGQNLYVFLYYGNSILKITLPGGVASVFAGGTQGSTDGTGTGASFFNARSMCINPSGNMIYLMDTGNNRVRSITVPGAVVSTVISSGLTNGFGICINPAGTTLFVADFNTNGIYSISIASPSLVTVATTSGNPVGIATDTTGQNLYISRTSSRIISFVAISTGVVTTIAGTGATGSTDGPGTIATFNSPQFIITNSSGNILYVLEDGTANTVRSVSLAFPPSLSVVGGYVGIGAAANTSNALLVTGDINYTGTLRQNGAPVTFSSPGINSAGNIGINSASNSSNALLVTGSQSNTGNLYIGGTTFLTSSSNTGTLGVAGGTILGANTGIGGASNSSNALLVTGSQSNTGALFIGGAATFVNSSNTGTLGVAGLATFVNSSNTGTLGVAGLATFVNSSNTGTLGVAGLATFVNSSNTGTLGVAGITTHSSNVGIFTTGVLNTQLDILGGHASFGSGGSNLIAFQIYGGGYRHFITTRHNSAANVNTNAIDFWLNNTTTSGGSSTSGTGNVNTMSITAAGLGVNCNLPGYMLDVNGSANINTTLRVVGLTTLANSSNTGTLGVAGLATLTTSSNTGIMGVAGAATFSSSVSSRSFTNGRFEIYPTTANNYTIMGLSGGNNTGFIYGDYQLLDDGIHMGYNYYGSNGVAYAGGGGTNFSAGASRISMGYGTIRLNVGTTSVLSTMVNITNSRVSISPVTTDYGLFAPTPTFVSSIAFNSTYNDLINGAPWYGIGKVTSGLAGLGPYTVAATQWPLQIANYYGINFVGGTNSSPAGSSHMAIVDGKVGISCNAPQSLLHITKDVAFSNITSSQNTFNYAQVQIAQGTSGGKLYLGNTFTAGVGTASVIQSSDYFSSTDYGSSLFLNPLGGNVGIGTSAVPAYKLDVNGPMQAAIFYSTITSGGTQTVTPSAFGVFYNITVSGTFTLAFAASQAASNIGKYICVRNNCGSTLSFTLTGVSGIASPVTLSNAQSATFVVATTTTYALF